VREVKPRIGIVQFPGVNCEYETARALTGAGMEAAILRWNESPSALRDFDGFVLPGGFSYEDRVRAGAIAANDSVMEHIVESASMGKPVLGICNGAQVLVESGLVPGGRTGSIDLALAPNKGMGRDGYYANWVFVRVSCPRERSFITLALEEGEVIPIPIAHSQGRFTSGVTSVFDRLDAAGQVALKYCCPDGTAALDFPEDPNGSCALAAAIANPAGNVVAMMPHPERSTWLRQVPFDLDSRWARKRIDSLGSVRTMELDGPGAGIFRSMKKYIEEQVW
jgi:phosphoribosylformylglycinamidine synthase